MNVTKKKIDLQPGRFKRTKIIATLGPATATYEQVLALIKAGTNGIRLNFSHGTHEEMKQFIKWTRKASQECGKPVAIIQDLQGPKIRLGDFEGLINVQEGQELRLQKGANYEESGVIPMQYDLSSKVKRGQRMFINDGRVRATVSSVKDTTVYISVENDGILLPRKGINLPDTDLSEDVLTKKDLKDLAFGMQNDVDYVALSFVHNEENVIDLKRRIKGYGSDARVITKLETRQAIERLSQIVQESDVIMIARGDLAYEIGPEAVPLVQRDAISMCHALAKQSIVATQMLISMVDQAEPSRAEVSDVSTAALLGADAVMLSDETTIGKYPIESVATMKRIVRYNEEHQPLIRKHTHPFVVDSPSSQAAICHSIVDLAQQLSATAIVAETKSGATAYQVSSHQPMRPIIAVTSSNRVAQQMAIARGVKSFVRTDSKSQSSKLTNWLQDSKVLSKGDVIVSVSGKYPGVVGTTDTIKVRVLD